MNGTELVRKVVMFMLIDADHYAANKKAPTNGGRAYMSGYDFLDAPR